MTEQQPWEQPSETDLPGETSIFRGFGFSGYRSFYGDTQYIGPMTKVTVLAGQNNSGKSNTLRFAQTILSALKREENVAAIRLPTIGGLDVPFAHNNKARMEVAIHVDDTKLREQLESNSNPGLSHHYLRQILDAESLRVGASPGELWIRFGQSSTNSDEQANPDVSREQALAAIQAVDDWNGGWERVHIELGGGWVDSVNTMQKLLARLPRLDLIPPIVTIDTGRRIQEASEIAAAVDGTPWTSGSGLINRLAELQSPTRETWRESRQKFDTINRFLQSVLDNPDVRISLPHDRSTIQVEWMGDIYPLESMGSGVPQIVILATVAAVLEDHLICIEEPETNLHPIQQKKLLRFLVNETKNQYLIATHSAHFVDSEFASVFHLRLGDKGTEVTHTKEPYELQAIFSDLGYRPSDLLQANCVVWVEGPTDRIYIRAWLDLVQPELIEGIDFSIMFYGGKLLRHLTVDPNAFDDFIDLRKLNRYSGIVIDSDRREPEARLNATKQRLLDEFSMERGYLGFAWVTECYTIENYIDPTLLSNAVSKVHPGRVLTNSGRQWDNPLAPPIGQPSFDKIAIAHEVVGGLREEDLDQWDLRDRIDEVAAFIRTANGY